MRVCVVPSDEGGCGFYRMRWPAETLIAQGSTEVVLSDREEADQLRADEFDAVVIQRPLRASMLNHMHKLQSNGIKVVVDIDDDFAAIPPDNIAFRDMHPARSPESNWNHLRTACRMADLVTVTTPTLAKKYGAHGRVAILPNYVPEWYLDIEGAANDAVTIGWSGAVETHPNDLEVTGGAVARVGASFRAVGTGYGVLERLGLDEGTATGWHDISGGYQRNVASLDIGIVPLSDSAFNRAKSWLKGLEFAALGVPFVASPTPEYERLHALGVGLLADKPKRWAAFLKALVASESYRKEIAEQGREVARTLTYERNAWQWQEAWATVANQKGVAA